MLGKIDFVVNREKNVLDIGCGTGDFVHEFAKNNAKVMAFDLSDSVAKSTAKRFGNYENVNIWCSDVASVHLPSESFDLITSITVLQHVVSDIELLECLKVLSAALKRDGYFLLIESISKKEEKDKTQYMKPRSREKWIGAFQETGLEVAEEFGYPHFAYTVLQFFHNLFANIGLRSGGTYQGRFSREAELDSNKLYISVITILLGLFKPIDYWLFLPLPVKYSKRTVFLLKKKKSNPK